MHAWMNGKRKVLLSVEKKTSLAPFFSKSLQKLLEWKEEEKLFTPFLGAENSGRISCTSESFSRNICEPFGCHKSREIHRECLFLFMLCLQISTAQSWSDSLKRKINKLTTNGSLHKQCDYFDISTFFFLFANIQKGLYSISDSRWGEGSERRKLSLEVFWVEFECGSNLLNSLLVTEETGSSSSLNDRDTRL